MLMPATGGRGVEMIGRMQSVNLYDGDNLILAGGPLLCGG